MRRKWTRCSGPTSFLMETKVFFFSFLEKCYLTTCTRETSPDEWETGWMWNSGTRITTVPVLHAIFFMWKKKRIDYVLVPPMIFWPHPPPLVVCNNQSLMGGWFQHYSFRCQPVDYSDDPIAIRVSRVLSPNLLQKALQKQNLKSPSHRILFSTKDST